ncbi:hypothetical protein [Bryobacter aggregatus]|uniref:hypothetical protein n=1 Tax=Bryobacter aggregatus TaxID=360054 RepID=UPI0004E2032C|nr:hypothetical protein [Bryobacter aggregatus]
MRILPLLIGLASTSFLYGQSASRPTAAQVLDRYVQVSGGKAAYAKIKQVSMLGTMEIKGQNVRGEMKMYRMDGSKYYTVVDLPGIGKQEDGSDGTTVWDKTVLGPRIKTGAERFLAICGSSAMSEYGRGSLDPDSCFSKAEFAGEETVDGKVAYKIVLTPKEGKPEEQYYEKATGLLLRTKMIMPSAMGEVPITMVVDEYKKIEGILMPVRLTQLMGPLEMAMSFPIVKFNEKLPENMFALPPEIQEMVNAEKAKP